MDLRLLQYFVAAAELEHIGKAAARLHISQSPLSRQIRQLESELGLELFFRERQRIRLTESGKWLLTESRKLLAHSEKIRNEAQARSLGNIGTLVVSFVSNAISNGILPKLLRRFHAEFPNAKLELRNMRSSAQIEAVHSGQVDLGFVSQPSDGTAIESICVSEEPLALAVPLTHPLSRKRKIIPSDLDGASWILLSHSMSHEKRARFLALCANAGFTPSIVQQVTEPNTLLGLIEGEIGVGLVGSSARPCAPRSVSFHNLPWLPLKSRIYMIRSIQGRQPLADKLVAYLSDIQTELPAARKTKH